MTARGLHFATLRLGGRKNRTPSAFQLPEHCAGSANFKCSTAYAEFGETYDSEFSPRRTSCSVVILFWTDDNLQNRLTPPKASTKERAKRRMQWTKLTFPIVRTATCRFCMSCTIPAPGQNMAWM